ncbi:MAG: thiol-disulfide oxidoreductase DCC family protein [Planctomycetota bacterium]|jgi:predicted DCC family thiol-disulfide oxidoreductase YuxK
MADRPFTLLYDGDCPLCRREVAWLRKRARPDRLAFVDVAASGFDAGPLGLTPDQVMARIHGIDRDGTIVTGMACFRAAYDAAGLGWLMSPTGWPLLRNGFDALYAAFARVRVPLGRVLGRRCDSDSCTVSSAAGRAGRDAA